MIILALLAAARPVQAVDGLRATVERLASWPDRSVGTPGNLAAADLVRQRLEKAGAEVVDRIDFLLPVLRQSRARLHINGKESRLTPLPTNAITPQNLPREGISGPLIYAGQGRLADFRGLPVQGAVVVLEFTSGRNWLNAASLGARGLIFVSRGPTDRSAFLDKIELSPIQFPCFWIEQGDLEQGLAAPLPGKPARLAENVRLTLHSVWRNTPVSDIYALFPGQDPKLREEIIVVQAFYDATSFLPGHAPGAEEALSVAALLKLADRLGRHPPRRSFLLLATNGHSQDQAGMREAIWAINARAKDLRREKKRLAKTRQMVHSRLELLKRFREGGVDADQGQAMQDAINHPLKLEVDRISTLLMRLRLDETSDPARIRTLTDRRLKLRQLGWKSRFDDLTQEERDLLLPLITRAEKRYRQVLAQIGTQEKMLLSAKRFRTLMTDFEPRALISLYLSSHGTGLGAFNRGFHYPLRTIINRTQAFRDLDTVLVQAAARHPDRVDFVSTLRPNRLLPWQDLLPDRPKLGGEVSCLAGLPGLTLATVNDLRPAWGTPWDRPDGIDWSFAADQMRLVLRLIRAVDRAPALRPGYIRNGFATISGRSSLLLHGELFAEHPAEKSVLLAFQGPARYRVITDLQGRFLLKGVADKKHVQDKVIIEGYRFSEQDGTVIWAIDKKTTGKPAYRLKMRRRQMKTDLVMFNCRQTTIFNLLEPRSLAYMTKIQLIDARRDAPPQRYWYSRIDTRSSIIASIFLEPGTRLKLTLSDNVLKKKLILTNGRPDTPMGIGYRIDDYPSLYHTRYLVARDMWTLLNPRIDNLQEHGIHDQRIQSLRQQGEAALAKAKKALDAYRYDQFSEEASRSWALASRVYDQVEKTQKDVLFGVLFYIALFVPFAFCAERVLFGFVSIYKRIIAFILILLLLIIVVSRVHPAFELAYSPTVVILAFFIIGLSALVTGIIVIRFEDEMTLLQRRTSHKRPEEISSWKAFLAAFFLGVSNLRRRRMRTALTCLTLVILTFTIMSFTTVKSLRRQNRLQLAEHAPYQGLLLKHLDLKDLPPMALSVFRPLFDGRVLTAPRVWKTADDPTRAGLIEVSGGGQRFRFQGLTGLAPEEPAISHMDRILIRGRWFRADEPDAVLIPSRLAEMLDLDPDRVLQSEISIYGRSFRITGIFSEKLLQTMPDLDGEPVTPAIFPAQSQTELSEVEKEALESGEDVQNFQGRYRHLDPARVLILPAATLMRMGGTLKAVALRPDTPEIANPARLLSDRFSLAIFQGEKDGVFLYNASDRISYAGMPNIVIPLVISVLIVLNTMISSVMERKREIAVYTSVGLAPSHVSFLFVAEALAFGVLAVVLGYLLAQTSASFLAGSRFWAGLTVNYSSLAGIGAMVLVMGVVLLSVTYPSRVAAEIAIPDVNRTWTLPPPENDSITVTLPFLMRFHEHRSVCGFLYSFFKGHQDISHGLFSCGEVEVRPGDLTSALPRAGSDCLHLQARVWLAPFDFGIMQMVEISFCRSRDDEDFLEICVRLQRQAGEAGLWYRLNTPFLHNLRKQLLVWRSLDQEGHRHFSEQLPPLPGGQT